MNIVVVILLFCFEPTILMQLITKVDKTIFVSVKNYLSKIFAIYILLLAIIPCSDICTSSSCLPDDKLHLEQSSYEDDHGKDLCSPLCICLCCNYVTSVSDKFNFAHFEFQSSFSNIYNQHFLHHVLESDSPPPKS